MMEAALGDNSTHGRSGRWCLLLRKTEKAKFLPWDVLEHGNHGMASSVTGESVKQNLIVPLDDILFDTHIDRDTL